MCMDTHFLIPLCLLSVAFMLTSCAANSQQGIPGNSSLRPLRLVQQEFDPQKAIPEGKFTDYVSLMRQGPVIPGLFQGAVPQGKAYIPEHKLMVISNYM